MNKVLVITGAASGIGKCTCKLFGQNGYSIYFNDFNQENGNALLDELKAAGVEAEFDCGDITKEEYCTSFVEKAVARFGRIDVLINNAGGLGGRSKNEVMTTEFYNHVMDLNMTSAFYVTRAAIPALKEVGAENGNASIINITSIAANNGGGPGASVYAASKAAIMGWSRGLAKELIGSGIRVNMISPGTIDTPFHSATAREIVESWKAGIPAGRLGNPEEVANVLEFLVSEKASYLVGEIIQINGGQRMD